MADCQKNSSQSLGDNSSRFEGKNSAVGTLYWQNVLKLILLSIL